MHLSTFFIQLVVYNLSWFLLFYYGDHGNRAMKKDNLCHPLLIGAVEESCTNDICFSLGEAMLKSSVPYVANEGVMHNNCLICCPLLGSRLKKMNSKVLVILK